MAKHPADPARAHSGPDLTTAVRQHLDALEPAEGERGLHVPKVDMAKLKAGLVTVDAKVQQYLPILDGLAPAQVKAVADIIAAALHSAASLGGGAGPVDPPAPSAA